MYELADYVGDQGSYGQNKCGIILWDALYFQSRRSIQGALSSGGGAVLTPTPTPDSRSTPTLAPTPTPTPGPIQNIKEITL